MVKQLGMYCKGQKSSIRICQIYIMHELSVWIMSISRLRRTFPNPDKKGGSMGVGLGIQSIVRNRYHRMPCQWCKEWRTPDNGDGKDYSIEVLCMSEARWINSGRRRLYTSHAILFSSRKDNHHSNGVAIIVSRMVKKTILFWSGSRSITCSSRHDWTPSLQK